jgi:hypothetical protein
MADCFEGAGTLAGYRDANEGHAAAELRKAGFATLTYDSASPLTKSIFWIGNAFPLEITAIAKVQ